MKDYIIYLLENPDKIKKIERTEEKYTYETVYAILINDTHVEFDSKAVRDVSYYRALCTMSLLERVDKEQARDSEEDLKSEAALLKKNEELHVQADFVDASKIKTIGLWSVGYEHSIMINGTCLVFRHDETPSTTHEETQIIYFEILRKMGLFDRIKKEKADDEAGLQENIESGRLKRARVK